MKKNKLTDIKFTSVDLVNRGANQDANIAFYKSDTPPAEDGERNVLKKAYDYLKGLFGNEEPETITKSDIANEYDGFATQLLKSLDGIIADEELNGNEKAEKMQKSIDGFSAFMNQAAPIWAENRSVVNSSEYDKMIIKADEITNRKENVEMKHSALTADEQSLLKSLLAKISGAEEKPENEPPIDEGEDKDKKPPFVPPVEGEETKKGEGTVNKSENIPEFVSKALERAESFMAAQELKEMTEVAKKYEVLGEKPDELAQQLYDLKKSDSKLYDTSIAMLDRQVDAIAKSGIFTEIGKSGAAHSYTGSDTVSKVETIAKSFMDGDSNLSYQEAMVKAWEAHPELVEEYERGE